MHEPPPTFRELFRRPAQVLGEASGRANLLGEHTDHSGGYVLPLSLPLFTRVELTPRDDRLIQVHSVQQEATARFILGEDTTPEPWTRYVLAAIQVAGARPLSGFDARIDSTVPMGAGLASSAAFLVALLRAFREAFQWKLSDTQLALLAQRAEVEFVGVPVGVMDPLVASVGRPGAALFVDTTSMRTEHIPLPEDFALAVVDSGIRHRLAQGEYRRRWEECDAAARALGVTNLRALSLADLPRIDALEAPLDRRARHVVTENARVLEAVPALRAGALPRLGALFDAAHRSLRDDFEVVPPDLDTLVTRARKAPGVLGVRTTGGGFGGSLVVLGRRDGLRASMQAVTAEYRSEFGHPAEVVLPE